MFRKILVPTDGSPLSEKAIKAAVDFAAEINATLVAISVAEPYPFVPPVASGGMLDPNYYNEDFQNTQNEYLYTLAREHAQRVVDVAKEAGVLCEIRTSMSMHPYEEIVKATDDFGCDLVFMASHGRKGLNKLFLGSETQKVIAHSKVPVMVFR